MRRLWSILLVLCLALGAGFEAFGTPPEPCCCGQVDEPCPCGPASCPGGSGTRAPSAVTALAPERMATVQRNSRLPEVHPLAGLALSHGPDRLAEPQSPETEARRGPPPGQRRLLLCTFRN